MRLRKPLKPAEPTLRFKKQFLKPGRHIAGLFLPTEYCESVGLIIAHWGNLEVQFNLILKCLIEAEASTGGTRNTKGWVKLNFRKRRTHFRNIVLEFIAPKESAVAKKLIDIIDTASSLHPQRNLIAHGMYSYTVPAHSSIAIECNAFDPESGERFDFDGDILMKLYHDIAHVTADLVMTFQKIAQIEGQFLAFSDTHLLQATQEKVHHLSPSSDTRGHQP